MVHLPPTDLNSELKTPEEGGAPRRPAYRPPLGFPDKNKRDLGGKIAAVLLHLLLILLVFAPLTSPELREEILGAGGAGPAGGGGGGHSGSGGGVPKTERTQMVQVAPPPKPAIVPTPQIKPPEVKPVVPPPPTPTPPAPEKTEVKTEVAPPAAVAGPPTAGTGGGTGNDGSNGTGPGSGGGKGAGVGTGTGSNNGPGTGGGPGTVYPPVPTVIFMPPIPTPSKIRGFEMIAEFDVDSTGKVLSVNYNHSKDSGYNKKLEETLAGVRFRPGVNGLGQPVRAKYQIVYTF